MYVYGEWFARYWRRWASMLLFPSLGGSPLQNQVTNAKNHLDRFITLHEPSLRLPSMQVCRVRHGWLGIPKVQLRYPKLKKSLNSG